AAPCGLAAHVGLPSRPWAQDFRHASMLPHLRLLPRGYPESGENWPLLLFLHGAGERGEDLSLVRKHGPPKLVAEEADFAFIVLAPQCPAGTHWRSAPLLQLLDQTMRELRVDPARVYVTG